MKLGIMQPYLFPYIGYFQLIQAVDKFVIYDDVAFIKQGWINRNKLLVNKKPFLFTVPLANASSFAKINNTFLDKRSYSLWTTKFIRTVDQNYRNAPFYKKIMDLVKNVFSGEINTIAELSTKSIILISDYLDLKADIIETSSIYNNNELKSQERILSICEREGADTYINAIGGQQLYDKEEFKASGVNLLFIKPNKVIYPQFDNEEFIAWLSILDVLMFNNKEDVRKMLTNYELV